MSYQAVLSRLASGQADQEKQLRLDFAGTVRALVENEAVNDGDVLAMLGEAGLTVADLTNECERMVKRRALRVTIEAATRAEAEIITTDDALAALQADFDAKKRQYELAHATLSDKLLSLQALKRAAKHAEKGLRETAPANLLEQRADLLQRNQELDQRREALKREILAIENRRESQHEFAISIARRNGTALPDRPAESTDLQRFRKQLAEIEAAREEGSRQWLTLDAAMAAAE